ncbi:MAG: DUF4836 family protein [Ferruginibacter sp.]
MQKRFQFLMLMAFAILIFTSCNKSNKTGRYIPKNASVVFHINGESITSKLPWSEIKQNQLFQEIYADTSIDATVKSALDNPENTGIDLKDDLTLFIQKDSAGGYVGLLGKIKDAEKFKTFYTNATKGNVVSGKDGESSLSNSKMITTWNKDRFVILFDAPQMNEMNMNRMPPMTGMDTTVPQTLPPVTPRNLPSLSTMIFNLEEKGSLAKDDKFSELMNTKGDFHFWMNVGEIGSQTAGMPELSMMNMSKMYAGTVVTGTANFLDGKIEMDMKSYAGKEMTDLFKKYEGTAINKEMVKHIPSKNVAVLFAMNFKPQGLLEFIKMMGIEGFANMGASYLGFTLDDFVKANKGEILLSISDMTKDANGKMDANYLFSASINDKASFNKLIEAGKKAGKNMVSDSTQPPVYFNSTDKYFAIGNKQAYVDTYIKTETNNNYDFFGKISGSPVGLFINFQYVMRAMAPKNSDSLDLQMYNASLQMWDNLVAKGGEFRKGGITQHAEINLVDKKMNSLKQLNNYFGIAGKINKQKNASGKNRWMDSTSIMADTTVAMLPAN